MRDWKWDDVLLDNSFCKFLIFCFFDPYTCLVVSGVQSRLWLDVLWECFNFFLFSRFRQETGIVKEF